MCDTCTYQWDKGDLQAKAHAGRHGPGRVKVHSDEVSKVSRDILELTAVDSVGDISQTHPPAVRLAHIKILEDY